jgi:hypothetical protein
LWFTCAANAKNGLHRSREDVRFAIRRALNLPMSMGWSDGRISEHVGCSPRTVGAVRAEMVAAGDLEASKTRIGKDGKAYGVTDNGGSGPQLADLPEDDESGPVEDKPEADEPEAEKPQESGQADIEDIPGVKQSAKVAPLIDPKWAHLPEHMRAVLRAHAELPSGSPGENGPWNGLGRPEDGLNGFGRRDFTPKRKRTRQRPGKPAWRTTQPHSAQGSGLLGG